MSVDTKHLTSDRLRIVHGDVKWRRMIVYIDDMLKSVGHGSWGIGIGLAERFSVTIFASPENRYV